MFKTINFSMFCDEWNKWEDRKDTFSYEGKKALFEYLEDTESGNIDSNGKPTNGIELDIIALCCDYTEFDSLDDVKDNWVSIKCMEDLENETTVLNCENGHLIVQNF